MASFLPVRPFGFPRTLRVFGGRTGYIRSLVCISASPAVYAISTYRPQLRGSWFPFCLRFNPKTKAHEHLTQASRPFSIFGRKGPSSPLNLSIQRLHSVALLWRSSTLRVWLPSQRLPSSFRPRIPLSGSNTLGLRPAKLCSFLAIQRNVSVSRSALALPVEPFHDLHPALQRFPPAKKAVSPPLEGLVRGETLALLGLSSSRALPSPNQRKSVSLLRPPSRSFTMNWSPTSSRGAPGAVLSVTSRLPS
jgi:hypothetical protein